MAISYSLACINARLTAVVNQIDASGNGFLILLANSTPISTISLANPCGVVSGGVLTFTGTLLDPSAAATGLVTGGKITDASGNLILSGLTAGVPGGSQDIIISNGLNSTLITAGQTVQVLAAQITGS